HANVIVLSSEEQEDGDLNPHPYWYAHIVNIFHVVIKHIGSNFQNSNTQRIKVLWVC
ncbi:hypothetical protein SERLA73DRAFT_45594, partial [Serpula lacrymans var. lacrymans S7.3]